ncbi:MAG TPA: hypothetical protein V6D43_09655 [Candidatus Sericytochromatia bacterium]
MTNRQLDAIEDNVELAVPPLAVRSKALPLQAAIKRVVNIPSINSLIARLTAEDAKTQRAALGILKIIHVENILEIESSISVILWLINSISV